jgi:MSHA biogenesis protein MshI
MGLLSKIFSPLSPKGNRGRIALQFSPNRVQIVSIHHDYKDHPHLDVCRSLSTSTPVKHALLDIVRGYKLSNIPTSIVLDPEDYQLFPADSPDLPRDEWQAAMRWQIQDHIDQPASEMVVELFDIPPYQSGARTGRIYIAAAPESIIKQRSHITIQSGFALENITIPEISLSALASQLPEQPTGLGLLQLGRSGGLLMIIRQQTLYLARSIINSTSLMAESNTFSDASKDEVALEVRRTLDFFEGTFDQPPIEALYMLPDDQPLAGLQQALTQRLDIQVKEFNIRQIIDTPPELSDRDLAQALPAISAAIMTNSKPGGW